MVSRRSGPSMRSGSPKCSSRVGGNPVKTQQQEVQGACSSRSVSHRQYRPEGYRDADTEVGPFRQRPGQELHPAQSGCAAQMGEASRPGDLSADLSAAYALRCWTPRAWPWARHDIVKAIREKAGETESATGRDRRPSAVRASSRMTND